MTSIQNKGTGAGGANTNLNGKTFEEKTENETRLIANGFIRKDIPGAKGKYDYFLEQVNPDDAKKSVVYVTQGGFRAFSAHFLSNNDMCRNPDEAYLFRDGSHCTLKILEKKNQNVAGSVDTKLLAGKGFIDEYEFLLGPNFKVLYAFCLSSYLKNDYLSDKPRSRALRHITKKDEIAILFGDDADYYETLDAWLSL